MARRRGSAVAKAAPGVPTPMMELGQSGLQRAGGMVHEEFLRQLQGAQGVRVYREMAANDAIIGAMLFAIEMLVRQVSWNVEPGGEGAEERRAAEWLETVPDDMSHSWSDFLSEWMAGPTFGFAPFEVVYKRRMGDQRDPGKRSRYDDGLVGVRKLAIRHPDTLVRWEFDEAGGVQAMVQSAPPHWGETVLPIEKLLLFRMRQRKGSPEGTSLLRNAYVSYYRAKRIEEIEAIGIERDLAGLPIAYVPPSILHPDASASDAALLTAVKKIVRNIRRDEQEGLVFPMVYDPEGHPLYKFELLTTGGRRQFDTSAIIERYDRRKAMTILADVILIGHEKVGSFALSMSKTQLFAAGLAALLDDIAEVLNRHLVPRLLRLNGMPTTNPPRFTHGDVESVSLQELGEYIAKLAGAGAPLFPDEELENYLRRAANLPDAPKDAERRALPAPGPDGPATDEMSDEAARRLAQDAGA